MAKTPNQRILVQLSNGVRGIFTGRAIAYPGHVDEIDVVDVKFFVPTISVKKDEEVEVTEPPAKKQPDPAADKPRS